GPRSPSTSDRATSRSGFTSIALMSVRGIRRAMMLGTLARGNFTYGVGQEVEPFLRFDFQPDGSPVRRGRASTQGDFHVLELAVRGAARASVEFPHRDVIDAVREIGQSPMVDENNAADVWHRVVRAEPAEQQEASWPYDIAQVLPRVPHREAPFWVFGQEV